MTGAALITGGAKRLGRAMAVEAARLGFDIAIHYYGSAAEADATVAELQAMGVCAVALSADLLDDSATLALVGQAAEALGRPLTLLVNNASIFEYDTLQSATLESWDRHIGSNLKAPFLLSQAFARQVPDATQGIAGDVTANANIINMIDQRVRKLTPEFMTYTLAKSALWTLTRTSAQALAPSIRVNATGPGPTLQGARQSEAHFQTQRAATILQRGADSEDIARTLRFIVESPALTGQLLCIDGGQHLGWRTPDILGVE
ncbi:SDR family oxidoreductase [Halovulum sp. GXIMD14793]